MFGTVEHKKSHVFLFIQRPLEEVDRKHGVIPPTHLKYPTGVAYRVRENGKKIGKKLAL